jgi:hypothetical protein
MRKSTVGILAAVAAVGFAQAAEAQLCAGFPIPQRGLYVGLRYLYEQTDADISVSSNYSWGVEAAYNAAGPLAVFGGLNVIDLGDHSANQYRAGVAFEVAQLGAFIGPRVSACPTAEVRWIADDGETRMQIPVGLGIGADLGLPAGPSVSGYVIPQVVFARLSGEGLETVSNTDFGVTGGVMVGLGQIVVGGELRHIFVTGADPAFGIRVGIRL